MFYNLDMANKKNNGNKKRVPQIVDLLSIILCAGGTFCLTVGIICFIRQVSRTYTLPFTWAGAIALFVGLVIAIIAHAAVYAKNKKAKQENCGSYQH